MTIERLAIGLLVLIGVSGVGISSYVLQKEHTRVSCYFDGPIQHWDQCARYSKLDRKVLDLFGL